jgi:hypothetical protein
MQKIKLILGIFFLITNYTFAQNFIHQYSSGNKSLSMGKLVELPSGNYIYDAAWNYTDAAGQNIFKVFFVKLDAQGNLISTFAYPDSTGFRLRKILFNGNCSFSGYKNINGKQKVWVGEIDSNFNIIQSKYIGSDYYNNRLVDIVEDRVICATNTGNSSFAITQYSMQGDSLHTSSFGTQGHNVSSIKSIVKIRDNYFAFVERQNPTNNNNIEQCMLRFDTNFNVVNYQFLTYGTSHFGKLQESNMTTKLAASVVENDKIITLGSMLNAAATIVDNAVKFNIVVTIRDSLGNLKNWHNLGSEVLSEIDGYNGISTSYDKISFVGHTGEFPSDTNSLVIMRYTNNFTRIWSRYINIGQSSFFVPTGVENTINGGVLVWGMIFRRDLIGMHQDIICLKLNSDGYLLDVQNAVLPATDFKVYPNPTTDYFVVELGNPNTPHSLVLRNILGEMILQIPMQLHPENLRINTQNLPTGIYTYTLTNAKGQQATGKIAKF